MANLAAVGIKKLYLVDSDKLSSMQPQTSSALIGGCSGEGSSVSMEGGGLSKSAKQQISNPMINPIEREVIKLDAEMQDILSKKNMRVRDKLLAYLKTLKRFLSYREQLEREESKTPVEANESGSRVVSMPPAGLQDRQVSEEHVDATASPSVQLQFADAPRDRYSEKMMLKDVMPNIRPRFSSLVQQLSEKKNFNWNLDDASVKIGGRKYPDANIYDLVLYRVKADMGEALLDPPPHYGAFNNYLIKHEISSDKEKGLRSRSVTLPVKTASENVAIKKAAAKRRDKRETLSLLREGRKEGIVAKKVTRKKKTGGGGNLLDSSRYLSY